MITYLKRFDQVSKIFNDLDNNKDQRVTFDEFRKGFELLYRRKANPMQLREAFDAIDTDHSGFIVFDEVNLLKRIETINDDIFILLVVHVLDRRNDSMIRRIVTIVGSFRLRGTNDCTAYLFI